MANAEKCQAELKTDFEKITLDGLIPMQDKYSDNKYLNIYQHFCKKEKKGLSLTQMYTTGLELQQKLDKIMDYDQCSEETANAMGLTDYCLELFQGQSSFTFWGEKDLKEKCKSLTQKSGEDKCATLNEHIFSGYHQTQ